MPIPDYQTIMLPLLKLTQDGQEHKVKDAYESIADHFGLSAQEKTEVLPSGGTRIIVSRVSWAATYLKKSKLLEAPRRGYIKITQRGIDVLKQNPETIDNEFLRQFPEFNEFTSLKRKTDNEGSKDVAVTTNSQTPEEVLDNSYEELNADLSQDLLQIIKDSSPSFFELLVIDLLVKMGYGGSRKDAGESVGRSGDEGIDGIIKEDKLGLDAIYIQAKRWDNVIGRPEVQKFAGALQGQRARKGIFITTSTFTRDATDYVSNIDSKIILVDGKTLTQLMIEHDVGVSTVATYNIKRIDSDYFDK